MDPVTGQDQQALLAQLAQAEEKLDRLVGDLRAIDGELEALSTERRQHRLLHDACGALEELTQLGGAALFWGDRVALGSSELRRTRSLVEGFEKRIGEIEDRRETAFEEIQRQQDDTEWLAGDVREAEEEEQKRQEEWIVEREISALPPHDLVMPWTRGDQTDERFRRLAATALAICFLLALVIPQIEIPLLAPEEMIAAQDRVVRLIMQARPLPPASKPVQEVPEEKPQVAEKTAPEPVKPTAGPGKGKTEGPSEGPGKGLLAFREQLSGIQVNQRLARLGSEARVSNAGAESGAVQRSMVTTSAPGSSGGINLAALSRGVNAGGSGGGGGAIEGVQIARATSTIAGGSGGGGAAGTGHGAGAIAGRTDEEIQIVFDRHKAELYRLYNRELRIDPTLRGQMILRLKIEPDGRVSLCELKGSDMRAPQLATQVVERVRAFDFGAKENIGAVTILYPIDFLPAG